MVCMCIRWGKKCGTHAAGRRDKAFLCRSRISYHHRYRNQNQNQRCHWSIPRPCRPISQCQSEPGCKQERKVVLPPPYCYLILCICKNIFLPFSQQSTVSFVVSQGTEQQLTNLDLDKLKTSSSSELDRLKPSSSSDLERLKKSSELEKDLPSELCKLRGESELSDLKLVKMHDECEISGPDQNSNCKSVENCAECVL